MKISSSTLTNAVLFCCLLVVTRVCIADTHPAEQVVKTTTDQVIERLIADKAELEANPDGIYELVNKLIIPHFDFVSMSKWVLGKTNWKAASPDQQERFVSEFRTLLVRTYAKALLGYSNNEIIFLPVDTRPNSKLVRVNTEVQSEGAKPIPINYTMHNGSGNWKVIDINVDGISLVATYRGSFAAEIKEHGMEALINKLANRNAGLAEDTTASN
jgi:phospholipid transport system substrate-binding protein